MSNSGFARELYRRLLNVESKALGAKRAKELDAWVRFGRKLDLTDPRTLADKICWIELNTDQTLSARCTDKWAVRDYVSEKGLGRLLVPAYGPWRHVEDIDLNVLPHSFALKATHGCEMNYLVPDKDALDVNDMFACAKKWLSSDYPRACVEPHYKLVPHRLYAEDFIGNMNEIVDYKFHCINGEPSFVLTCSERDRGLKLNLYDLDWNPIKGLQGSMKNDKEVDRPRLLDEMIDVSRTLSSDFNFVRVDLYETDGGVMFGELTFSPACGIMNYYTDEFIGKWGEVLRVDGLC